MLSSAAGVDAIGARGIPEFEGVHDVWPRGDRLEAVRAAAASYKPRFKAHGTVLGVQSPKIAAASYPVKFAFRRNPRWLVRPSATRRGEHRTRPGVPRDGGNLSYQVEHHLFPDMPSSLYQEIAPRVKEICERYGLPYNTGPFHQQWLMVQRTILRLAFPGGEPRPKPGRYKAPAAEVATNGSTAGVNGRVEALVAFP